MSLSIDAESQCNLPSNSWTASNGIPFLCLDNGFMSSDDPFGGFEPSFGEGTAGT
jgi:hypothetical protein